MRLRRLHGWPRTTRTALALQRALAGRVRLEPLAGPRRLIAGVDAAFSRDGSQVIAGVALWDAWSGALIETHVARAPCRFPYVPGLLTFRELPGVLAALQRLRRRPDVVLCDAQGIAHPRRIGLASHLGLWLDLPSVGCAKSRLCGTHDEPGARRAWTPLHPDGRVEPLEAGPLAPAASCFGAVLRTREGVRPLYISPGHRSDLAGAIEITLACLRGFRLPEPTRAHRLVTAWRRRT